jgi:hypothetical protein
LSYTQRASLANQINLVLEERNKELLELTNQEKNSFIDFYKTIDTPLIQAENALTCRQTVI